MGCPECESDDEDLLVNCPESQEKKSCQIRKREKCGSEKLQGNITPSRSKDMIFFVLVIVYLGNSYVPIEV